MNDNELLTLAEAAQLVRLRTAETFARFARRHGIPLVKIGRRVVRVRVADLKSAIEVHREGGSDGDDRRAAGDEQ